MTKLAVRRPVTTFMVILIFISFGLMSLTNLQMDLLPNMNIPVAMVMTTYQGASPEQMQELVTEPMERALATIAGLDTMYSRSSENSSVVEIMFDQDIDIDFAALDIREAVDGVKGSLPEDVSEPMVMKMDMNAMIGIVMAISSDSMDLVALQNLVEDRIEDRLTRQSGVASVTTQGGREREIRVDVIEDRIRGYGISETQISALLGAENSSMPIGAIEDGGRNLTIKLDGEFTDIEEIKRIPIQTPAGATVYLGDIANVYESFVKLTQYGLLNGDAGVILSVQKQSTANTVNVSRAVRSELDRIIEEYPDLNISVVMDPADYITQSIDSVTGSAVMGTMLAILVLFIFLRNVRSTLVVGTAIPVSILVTFALMYFADMTLNLMSLGGLTLGVGMLVDNSIVVLESIFRRMERGESKIRAAINGAKEVAMSIMASTLTTIAVFVPVAFVGGMIAQVFNDLAISISFSLMASLVVALTFVPLACSLFLSPTGEVEKNPLAFPKIRYKYLPLLIIRVALFVVYGILANLPAFRDFMNTLVASPANAQLITYLFLLLLLPYRILGFLARLIIYLVRTFVRFFSRIIKPFFDWVGTLFTRLENAYRRALTFAVNRRKLVWVLTAVFFVGTMISLAFIGWELMPAADQSQITVNINLPAGAVQERTEAVSQQVLERIERIPKTEIKDVILIFGNGGTDSSQVMITLHPVAERTRSSTEIADEMRNSMSDIAGAEIRVQALTDMMGGGVGGGAAGVQYMLNGSNIADLVVAADRMVELLEDVPGLREPQSDVSTTIPQATIRVDRMKASSVGLSSQVVMGIVNNAVSGSSATTLKTQGDELTIRVGRPDSQIENLEQLRGLLIPSPLGVSVPLREIAEIVLEETPISIFREDQITNVSVEAQMEAGYVLSDVSSAVSEKIESELILPAGVTLETAGSQQQLDEEMNNLIFAFFLAIVVVYAIMAAEFESMYYPLVIMGTVPLAFSAGVTGLLVMGNTMNITSALGFIMLVGIVINNAIVLVDYINLQRGNGLTLMDAVCTAGPVRLRAILMTTLTTVLGLLPMMLGMQEGSEMMQPLATVVIWGLGICTLLTLFVVPTTYITFETIRTRLLGERKRFRHIEEMQEGDTLAANIIEVTEEDLR